MQRILKILGILIGIGILLFMGFAAYIHWTGVPKYERAVPAFAVDYSPERVERGMRLAGMVCANCHAGPEGSLSGGPMWDLPPEFGTAHAPNITQHSKAVMARYSDADLAYLLRTGIKKDGGYAPPYMPKFPHMADEDLRDIIAYLRSDHWTVRPKDVVQPECKPSFMTKMLCNLVFKPLPYPEKEIRFPDSTDMSGWGEYLVHGRIECYSCHSADFKTINIMEPERSEGYLGGGNVLLDTEGNKVFSSNITMHENGIGYWTEAEFIQAVKWGKRPDGDVLSTAMPKYTQISDWEARAIYAYLKTVPEIDHVVERSAVTGQ